LLKIKSVLIPVAKLLTKKHVSAISGSYTKNEKENYSDIEV